ncbi:XRE family transcriptional regulator [Sulfuriflexus mobilis]|uniref:XRE family transcriptional regulator n=1 Tax=Sulfuriflexus mobilis TaxID=1811807 RepID=UPI000F84787C|nr:helix-turn-helix transcriptional regulator [Sulfuriflexus mobilis]
MTKRQSEPNIENRNSVPILTHGIGTRITATADRVGGKKELAARVGLSESQLHRIVAGDSQAKVETIASMAKAGGVSIEWLATGEGPMMITEIKEQAATYGVKTDKLGDEYAYIPLYDVRAAAGHGSIVESEQVIDSLAFKQEWLHNELHINPSDLYLIYVQGESMEPTLRAGDVILVDRSDNKASREGIYVLVMDGTLLVKRIQSLPGGRMRISSDNPAYEPFEMEKVWFNADYQDDREGAGVIGRVVWSGRRM